MLLTVPGWVLGVTTAAVAWQATTIDEFAGSRSAEPALVREGGRGRSAGQVELGEDVTHDGCPNVTITVTRLTPPDAA